MTPGRRRHFDFLPMVALALLLFPRLLGGTEPVFPYLPVEQIHPGMVGTGRTVFQGHVPEEFQVEILGVLKNAIGPQQDMILSRLHGKNVERTGVISGMSGSPVTVDGKLIGAISYRLGQFEKEAIAGITPITDMLKAAELATASASGDGEQLLAEWEKPGKDGTALAPIPTRGFPGNLVPIGTPLVFAGFPDSVFQQAAPLFRSRGLEPMQGGGGTGSHGVDYPIEPGVPIAAELVRGDLSLAGTGTLTHVLGNRVWAFGHPFLDAGAVRIPMARAEIVVTYPSALGSFKISNATSPMGTLVQDRLTCIQGVLGPAPEMIPVTVDLDSPSGRRRLSYQVFENKAYTPILLAITTQASLQRVLEYSDEVTYRTELRIETEGHVPVRYTTVETNLGGPQSPATTGVAREVATVFNIIFSNRFETPRVTSVGLGISSIPKARLARVGEVSISPSSVHAGEEVTVRAVIQPFRGEPLVQEFHVRVPPDTPPGPMAAIVSSASSLNAIEANTLQRRFAGSAGLDPIIEFLNSLKTDDRLYLAVTRRGLGAVVQGKILPALPLSTLFTLGSDRFAGEEYPAADLPVIEASEKTDYVLTGGRRTTIQVR